MVGKSIQTENNWAGLAAGGSCTVEGSEEVEWLS